jgi:hypothetical protein
MSNKTINFFLGLSIATELSQFSESLNKQNYSVWQKFHSLIGKTKKKEGKFYERLSLRQTCV